MSAAAPSIATRSRWPWVLVAVYLLILPVTLWLTGVNGRSWLESSPAVIAFTAFGVLGAMILSEQGDNVIGLLLISSPLVLSIGAICGEIATWLIRTDGSSSLAIIGSVVNTAAYVFGVIGVLLLITIWFPDGRPPSRRWRLYPWAVVIFLVLSTIILVVATPELSDSGPESIPNTLYVPQADRLGGEDVIGTTFFVLFALGVASLFVRFRRSAGIERQQVKWMASGVLFALVGLFIADAYLDGTLNQIVSGIAFSAIPVAVGVAVLRFHLFDLDVVIKKAVLYATLVLFATAIYLALVVVLGAWLGRGDSFLTMLAAVIVAVTFQPARQRLERFANRVVYGKRATLYEVLTQFSDRVGDAYAQADVLPRMARILGEGIGAEESDVWLAVDEGLRRVASWPEDIDIASPIALHPGEAPAIIGMDRVVPVEQGGELLGALAIRKPASDPVSPADEKLIGGLAAQAGLVLRNVRLTEDLKLRLDDLKALQRRLVSAQDEGRRRLERNIHDGAQQQLVALAVKLKLADGLVERDTTKTHELLAQLQDETHAALQDLRDLARGIYPPLLADKGLPAAIEAQVRKSGLPAEVRATGVGRYPQAVESAVYFSCLEALQNVAKYAHASNVVVELAERDGAIRFTVRDDGVGFDMKEHSYGTGLQGIADRLGALDGRFTVTSAPGQGTTLEGSLPSVALMMASA